MLIPFPVSASPSRRYSLCVVGAGPAGIIVALEYARNFPERRVLLVDYGVPRGSDRNALDDHIVIRNPINHHAPYECTNKGLGGSSATWGGRCVMYDRGDFHPRSIIGDGCTWGIEFYENCLPHVAAAQRYFESGSGPFDLVESDKYDAPLTPLVAGFHSALITDTVLERWSLPTRFGQRYEAELKALPNLDLLLGAEARTLPSPDSSGRVSGVTLFQVGSNTEFHCEAESIVLASGGQEVTRLLLKNPQVFSRLPSPPAALGRYYQGHVSGKIASVQFTGDPKLTEYGFRREADGSYQRRRFQFTEQTMVRHNLLNTAFWLDNPLYFDPSHRSGAMSFMYLAMLMPILGKRLAPPAVAHSITKGKINRIWSHLWNIIMGLPESLWTPMSIFAQRYLRLRKLPGVFLYSSENRYALHFHSEQIPTEENCMQIADDGQTLLINYCVTEADARAVIRAHKLFDEELRASGVGRLDYWFSEEERLSAIISMSKDGVHQSGTTRIADDPARGVVDNDLCVWGTNNLYVCSSSVFPTSGQANPTFFLGVCSIRLANHLARLAR